MKNPRRIFEDRASRELHVHARQAGTRHTMKRLLENGADITHRDEFGRDALILATVSPDVTNLLLLLRNGADIATRDHAGDTVLHWAAYHHNHAALRLLFKKGAQLDAKNDKGETPSSAMYKQMKKGLRRGVSPARAEDVRAHKKTIAVLRQLKTGKITRPFTHGTAVAVSVRKPLVVKFR